MWLTDILQESPSRSAWISTFPRCRIEAIILKMFIWWDSLTPGKKKKKKNEWMTLSIHGRIERTFYPSLKDFKQKFDFFFSGPMTPQMNQAPHQVITTHSNSSEGKGAPLDWKRNSLTLIALIKPDGLCYHFNFSKSKGETAIMQTHFKLHFNQILYGCFYEFNKNGHLSAAISLWT